VQQNDESGTLAMLLSAALVAFTIEFDNEAEHRLAHRTTRGSDTRRGPWLVSLAMWSNCMRLVGAEGIAVSELEHRAGATTNFGGMVRWGYIAIGPDRIIRTTAAGRRAQAIWGPLFDVIEQRWESRFGAQTIAALRRALLAVLEQIPAELPEALPILGYGLVSPAPQRRSATRVVSEIPPLSALLSKVLLAYALAYERESELSLAIGANVLRVTDESVRVSDLPRLSGVSKEAIAMALNFLIKRGYAEEQTEAGVRGKRVALTPKGRAARAEYERRLKEVEAAWRKRFGSATIDALKGELEPLQLRLSEGLQPYPDGWRAALPSRQTLPHYPMVLHRGGFPDGS
jgi:DNA-binding MarR family transcriptional regulator